MTGLAVVFTPSGTTNPDPFNRSRKVVDMTTMTLHNVPDEVRDALTERANRAG
jgi:hypothetical protein